MEISYITLDFQSQNIRPGDSPKTILIQWLIPFSKLSGLLSKYVIAHMTDIESGNKYINPAFFAFFCCSPGMIDYAMLKCLNNS